MAISLHILGQRLKEARVAKSLTQEAVAEKIGFSVAHLSKIERGVKPINLIKLSELCDVLDIPVEWVIVGATTPKNAEYNQQFGEIVSDCPPDVVAIALDATRQVVRAFKRGNEEPTAK